MRGLMTATEVPSITQHTRLIAADAPVVGAYFLDGTAVFVLGEEALLFVAPDREPARVAVHSGAILASACDGERILTGGDDGKVMTMRADLTTDVVAADAKRRWIDHLAIGPDGAIAWSAGRDAFARTGKGSERRLEAPSTVGGIAFAPKGLRLAIAHYHGVTLWFPNAAAPPERLEWKGSHLGVSFSPDGRFLVTAMQEPALHGWRLADGNNLRMSGYPAKVRSMSWNTDGKALATSGANELILWSFQGKDGPMGKDPQVLAPAAHRIAIVACHPRHQVAAVGYEDGMALLIRLTDSARVLTRNPGGAPISALAWDRAGYALAFGTEDGEAGIVNLP
jgi:WD40 repeat protein